jgi:hypothetical protein
MSLTTFILVLVSARVVSDVSDRNVDGDPSVVNESRGAP